MQEKALKGIRILDFGAFLAGPVASMIMAHLGAEVIKVENPKGPDGARFFMTALGVKPVDYRIGAQLFDASNFGKYGTSIDVSKAEGRELILKLAEKSDILIENMSVGALAKHGLGYEDVKKRNPNIIYVSSTACGQTGPESNFIGYAATFANKSGLGALTGYPGSIPSTFVGSVDLRSAVTSAYAMLAAIYHRDETGEGQYIDVASQEAIAAQLGDVYLDYIGNGTQHSPQANHRFGYAPQGAYPSAGEDTWVAISVGNDGQWNALCNAMGNGELAKDPRFASHALRQENQDALDEIIAAWTGPKGQYDVVSALQAVGVPSGPVLNTKTLHEDPHIQERGCFVPIEHPAMGTDIAVGAPWRFSETVAGPTRRAPILGEHTVQVLKNVLGMGDAEIGALHDAQAIREMFD